MTEPVRVTAEAFEALNARLIGYFCRRGCTFKLAEDLCQETWLRVLRAERRNQAINQSYVFLAAHSVLVDEFRHARYHHAQVSLEPRREWGFALPAGRDQPAEQWRTLELEALFPWLRDALTADQATAIELQARGWQLKQISVRIGRSVESVKKLLVRGRLRARKAVAA